MPWSGSSSEMAISLSPNRRLIVSTAPFGSVIRLSSWAPSTDSYHWAARTGSPVTMCMDKVGML